VAGSIRERISRGVYPVGSRLPAIGALADEFKTSHMTVKQALSTLSSEGVVASRRGVPAEVIAIPSPGPQPSLAERLASVEGALQSLEERVTAMEGHDSNSNRAPSTGP
jgi:DNA-binding GntR family transcriptional regulator